MTVFFYLLNIFVVVITLCTSTKLDSTINFELVSYLQEFFKTDLTLVAVDNKNYDFVKQLYKNNSTRGFIGAVDINENFENYFKKEFISPYQNVMVILNSNFTEKLADSNLMASAIWVYFTEVNYKKKFEHIYIPFNCRFLIINKIGNLDYEIQDVYQISPNSSKIYSHFADWKNGELNVLVKEFYSKRMDLKGYQLNVALTSFLEFRKDFSYLWRLLSEKMNFSINWETPSLGKLYPNGTKTELFKLIYDREIDGSPINIVFTHHRSNVYDYIFPTLINEVKIYAKKTSKLNWTSYIAPFDEAIWIAIFLWIILISSVKYLIIRLKKCHVPQNFEGFFFSVVKALFNQAGNFNTSNSCLCILYIMPYFFAIVLTQYYSGALSSYLSVRISDLPFTNLKGIIMDKTYKISVMDDTYSLFYLTTNMGRTATTIRENNLLVEMNQLPKDTATGFRQLCSNQWVFFGPSLNLVIKEDCEIVELKEKLYPEIWGIIVWKGFPLKDVLTKWMRRLQFAGLVKLKMKNKIVTRENLHDFKPFSMELVFPVFLLYLFACILSVLILICERNWSRSKKCQKYKF